MTKLSNILLGGACFYALYMATATGFVLKEEADKLVLPPVEYEVIDKELLQSLANCNVEGFLTIDECAAIHGLL